MEEVAGLCKNRQQFIAAIREDQPPGVRRYDFRRELNIYSPSNRKCRSVWKCDWMIQNVYKPTAMRYFNDECTTLE